MGSTKVQRMRSNQSRLPWLAPGDAFPHTSQTWQENSPAPGLLAAGGDLTVPTLTQAYRHGIFPWFSDGQPILWWSPNPRMVLNMANFRLHRSLRKTLRRFQNTPGCHIQFDSAFARVIENCSSTDRAGQNGTWIVADMVRAYGELHQAGLAHSVEVWRDDQLVGGLYCVALGQAVFGESMFSHATDASKIALAALVSFCRHHGITRVDCQQNTRHLASMGAAEIPRDEFLNHVASAAEKPSVTWQFDNLYWQQLLPSANDLPILRAA
jgi:leucyl/phenylalanyl-tRNA--protein transferase